MSAVERLKDKIGRRECTIGVIGLGYVGLPLVLRFGEVGFRIIGSCGTEERDPNGRG